MIVICITIICILIIGELCIRNDSDNPLAYKKRYIIENGHQINTLILGSSHTYNAIKPDCFREPAFNLAYTWQPLSIDYKLLLNYIENLPNLKCIMLPLSCHSLRSTEFIDDGFWRNLNYSIYMDIDIDCSLKDKIAVLSPGYLRYRLKTKIYNCDNLGWGGDRNLITNKPINWEQDIRTQPINKYSNRLVDSNVKIMSQIIEICKERSIRLIVVTTPVWHTYYENINDEIYDEIISTIELLQVENKLEYYNFLKDSRFVADDFYDVDHLSNIGAEKFSRMLIDTLGM